MHRTMALLREASTIILRCHPSTSPRSASFPPILPTSLIRDRPPLSPPVQGLSSTKKDGSASGRFAEHAHRSQVCPGYRVAVASLTADTDCKQSVILVQVTKQELLVQHPYLMTTFVGDSCDYKVRLERGTVPEDTPSPNGRA